jgi:hypothetical protein
MPVISPTLDATAALTDTNNGVSTWGPNFTVGSLANYLIVLHFEFDVDTNLTDVKYNGVAMTPLTIASVNNHASQSENVMAFGLANPAVGTHPILCTYTGGRQYDGFMIPSSWKDVSAIGAKVPSVTSGGSGFNPSATSPLSTPITMAPGSVAVSGAYISAATTIDGSQTLLGSLTDDGGENIKSSYKLDATAMITTFTGSARAAQLVIELMGAGGSPTLAQLERNIRGLNRGLAGER